MSTTGNTSELNAIIRKLAQRQQRLEEQNRSILDKYEQFLRSVEDAPRSITQEIDSIPGRRIYYNLVGRVPFTAAQDGTRGNPVTFLVSQDGPFIQTHYPVVIWKPNSPDDATNYGRWRPIYSWPLPDQVLDVDTVDLSYEVIDSGSQRNFQNEPAPPMLSRPDVSLPLPVPTLFAPNTTIQFFPTYERILFDSTSQVPTTGGLLTVALPGYKIVNL